MSDNQLLNKSNASCRSPDSLLQLQLAQLRKRNGCERVFTRLPPFLLLQRQWPLLLAIAHTADAGSVEPEANRRNEAQLHQ